MHCNRIRYCYYEPLYHHAIPKPFLLVVVLLCATHQHRVSATDGVPVPASSAAAGGDGMMLARHPSPISACVPALPA